MFEKNSSEKSHSLVCLHFMSSRRVSSRLVAQRGSSFFLSFFLSFFGWRKKREKKRESISLSPSPSVSVCLSVRLTSKSIARKEEGKNWKTRALLI